MSKEALEQKTLFRLERVKAVFRNGHYVYTKGGHGEDYVNKDAVTEDPEELFKMAGDIALEVVNLDIEVVVAPVQGASILGNYVALHLSRLYGRKVFSVYAEKEGDGFVLKRGYDKRIKFKRILIVEDIVNTGGSIAGVVRLVESLGGVIVKAAAIWNRNGVPAEKIGLESDQLFSLVTIQLPIYPKDACPLCAAGRPVNTELGKGKDFLAAQAAKTS